jgi:predicted dehydrogenase
VFDAVEKQIDTVVVSTPDHPHFHPAWWPLERGKLVHLEKPLAHEMEDVRRLTGLARTIGLATQLGAQRHARSGLRAGVEIVKAGMLGTITEVHCYRVQGEFDWNAREMTSGRDDVDELLRRGYRRGWET